MLDLLDRLLSVLTIFDVITPLSTLVQNLARGPSFTFRVPHRAGWGAYSVEAILKDAGCNPVWGKRIVRDTMMMNVKLEQAQKGYWALHKADVPMENDVPRGVRRAKRKPKQGSSLLDELDRLLDW
jgi:hypothetical protein